jgi:hypothetical protein
MKVIRNPTVSVLHSSSSRRYSFGNLTLIYCNAFDQRFARQQLCKHGPPRNNRWGCVFYVVSATPSAANGPRNSQSDTWHVFSVWSASRNNRRAVFSVAWSVPRGYERIREWELTSLEFRSSKRTAMWPEEELEDLVCGVRCAVVYRYWECVI